MTAKVAGGVAVYIKDNGHGPFVENKLPQTKTLLLCVLYRPPDSKVAWFDQFHNRFTTPYALYTNITLVGDFNINLLNALNTRWTQEMECFGLKQMVNLPTRQTDETDTLIDHIYTTCEKEVQNVLVTHIKLGDHYQIFFTCLCHFTGQKSSTRVLQTIEYRGLEKIDTYALMVELRNSSWEHVLQENSYEKALDTWNLGFLKILDKHAPVRRRSLIREVQPLWINTDIQEAITMRRKNQHIYRIWRNKVTSLLLKTKQEYFMEEINSNIGNSKALWCVYSQMTLD